MRTIFLDLLSVTNPSDKSAISWRSLCLSPHPSYHSLSALSPSTLQTIPLPSTESSALLSLHAHRMHQHPLLPQPLLAPSSLESDLLTPAGLFVGVFSIDRSLERRMLIRSTWANADVLQGDRGNGLKGTRVRFIMGRPSPKMRELVRMEMEGELLCLCLKTTFC